jgi:hypothetical protein
MSAHILGLLSNRSHFVAIDVSRVSERSYEGSHNLSRRDRQRYSAPYELLTSAHPGTPDGMV